MLISVLCYVSTGHSNVFVFVYAPCDVLCFWSTMCVSAPLIAMAAVGESNPFTVAAHRNKLRFILSAVPGRIRIVMGVIGGDP